MDTTSIICILAWPASSILLLRRVLVRTCLHSPTCRALMAFRPRKACRVPLRKERNDLVRRLEHRQHPVFPRRPHLTPRVPAGAVPPLRLRTSRGQVNRARAEPSPSRGLMAQNSIWLRPRSRRRPASLPHEVPRLSPPPQELLRFPRLPHHLPHTLAPRVNT